MTAENPPPKQPARYASRNPTAPRSGSQRLVFRLLGLPILALAAWYFFNGVRGYLELPQCDSAEAKKSLAAVLKQMNFEPSSYEQIKTVSSSKEAVVCNAVLPLPGGGSVVADYTFFWQGHKVNMRYSIEHQVPRNSLLRPSTGRQDVAGTR